MKNTSDIADMVEMEVRLNYVTASWVAWFYDVPLAYIYRAVEGGRLKPVEVPTAKSRTWLFDRRRLPATYPYGTPGRKLRGAGSRTPAQRLRREERVVRAA